MPKFLLPIKRAIRERLLGEQKLKGSKGLENRNVLHNKVGYEMGEWKNQITFT